MWDQRFEELVRQFLPFLGGDEAFDTDLSLRDAGLDSLGTVELLGRLEDLYDVRFLDDALSPATFATPGALWSQLSVLTGSAV